MCQGNLRRWVQHIIIHHCERLGSLVRVWFLTEGFLDIRKVVQLLIQYLNRGLLFFIATGMTFASYEHRSSMEVSVVNHVAIIVIASVVGLVWSLLMIVIRIFLRVRLIPPLGFDDAVAIFGTVERLSISSHLFLKYRLTYARRLLE